MLTLGFASAADAERAVAVVQGLTDRERRDARARHPSTLTAPDGDALLPSAVRALDAAGIGVARATGVPPTLDDVFLALTGRTLREAGEGEPTDEDETTPEKTDEHEKKSRKTDQDAAGSRNASAAASEKTGAKR